MDAPLLSRHGRSTKDTACTLVWIDAREATIVRTVDGRPRVERIESDVPPHRRSTGHVRHDPGIRHGGGGSPQTAGEGRRLEHLAQYLELVAARIPDDEELLILGAGTVREQLERRIAAADVRHGAARHITCAAAAPMTEPQLVARFEEAHGGQPRRLRGRGHGWRRGLAAETSATGRRSPDDRALGRP